MRLARFRLERYGPFEYLDLPLDPAPGRVNLIVAPNGYGKSVIRNGIGEFLFGIEARTSMSFRFGTERMLLKADIVSQDETLSLVRRKGHGNTLALAAGPEISPDQTYALLGGANPAVFRELFGLDTTLLRSGGNDLIRSHGRLGQVLFAAGGGMARVRDLLSELERKRDDLGRANSRHRSRPIWNALSNWEQANQDLRRTALRPDNWQALEREATETEGHLRDLLQEQAEQASERDQLNMLKACRPWLDRRGAAIQALADCENAPDLDAEFEKRWRLALEDSVRCAIAAETAKTDLEDARKMRAALTFDPAWVAAELDIAALADLRGQVLAAETDLPKVQHECGEARAKATALRRDLGFPETLPLPPVALVKDAQKRLQQHPKLDLEAGNARERLEQATGEHADTLKALEALPEPAGIAAIAGLTALLRRHGDPAIRLETAERKLRDADAAFHAALGAMPDNPLSEVALTATVAPSDPRLEAAAKALTDAEAARAAGDRELVRRMDETETARQALAALEQSAGLPSPDALALARAQRDAMWADFLTPDPARVVAFDRAIRIADNVADALIAHGQEVAKAAELRGRLAALQAETDAARETGAQAETALTAARNRIATIARNAGGSAEDMASLRAFLRARERAQTCYTARRDAAAETRDLQASLTELGGNLANSLGMRATGLAALPMLLTEADRRIEAQHTRAAERKLLTEQVEMKKTAMIRAGAIAAKAERALADWTVQWAPIAASLARAAGENLAATADTLARVEELRAAEYNAADAGHRVELMQDAIALLATRVRRLTDLSAEIGAMPPVDAAEAFRRHLQTELQQAARCRDADQRIAQAAEKHNNAEAAANAATRALSGLRAALRCDTDEAAEQQLQRARARATARADMAEATHQLANQGGGLTIPTLIERAVSTTAEADLARIAEIEASHAARLPRIDTARTAAADAAAARDGAEIGVAALEAAERREAALAALSRTSEEALILHAARALLQAALDRRAAGADQPLLNRIGAVFRTITGGAQAGVRVEDTRDGQTMVALEADGITRKPLDQLSEGTTDQLYLALRIAALEDYAANATPLPFIADDILQTFDDPRTLATLHALADLSRTVQVIVLTHHPHIGMLAAGLPDGVVRLLQLAA